jgi:hypothetical protein
MNPVLDRIDDWNRSEYAIERLFGIDVLRGADVRNG